jgi:hypothetical protein
MRTERHVKGNSRVLLERTMPHWRGGTREDRNNEDSLSLSRDPNPPHTERKAIVLVIRKFLLLRYTTVYPKVSGLAAWSENCKWYGSLPLGAVVSLFCESV